MDLENRIKKIRYVAAHRGTKEADIIVSQFADHFIKSEKEIRIKELETFLEVTDLNLLDWYFGRKTPNDEENTPIVQNFLNWSHASK